MSEVKQDYLLKPSVIARRKREGKRNLYNARKKKGHKKQYAYIDEDRICYDETSSKLLKKFYLRIVKIDEIRSFISKHRLAIYQDWSILAEIRHNYSNYDEIWKESKVVFEDFPERRDWFYGVLKWEVNNLIIDTYGKYFAELQN